VGKSDSTAHSASVNHFVWVRINGEKLTLEAVDASGTVFDVYDIDKQHRSHGTPFSVVFTD
jgi:hypothetical protein